MTWPAYLETHESGELARRVEEAVVSLGSCRVCPRNCEVDRLQDQTEMLEARRLFRRAGLTRLDERSPLTRPSLPRAD